MVKVPTQSVHTAPMQVVEHTPQAYGSEMAAALGKFGRSVGAVGDTAFGVHQAEKKRLQDAEDDKWERTLREREIQITKQVGELSRQYQGLEGRDAVYSLDQFNEALDKIEAEAASGIDDEDFSLRARQIGATRVNSAKNLASTHYNSERNAYNASLSTSRMEIAMDDVGAFPADPGTYRRARAVVNTEVEQLGLLQGASAEEVEDARRNRLSELHLKRMLSLVDQNLGMAKEVRGDIGKELTREDAAEIDKAIAERTRAVKVEGHVIRATSRISGSGAKMHPKVDEDGAFSADGLNIEHSFSKDFEYGGTPKRWSGIVLHHTEDSDVDSAVAYGQRVDEERGGAFGYHFYIGQDGRIVQGAPLTKKTNHVKAPGRRERYSGSDQANSNSIAISFVGAAHVNARHQAVGSEPTEAQVEAAQNLVAALSARYGIDQRRVMGHGELQSDRYGSEGSSVAQMIRMAADSDGGPSFNDQMRYADEIGQNDPEVAEDVRTELRQRYQDEQKVEGEQRDARLAEAFDFIEQGGSVRSMPTAQRLALGGDLEKAEAYEKTIRGSKNGEKRETDLDLWAKLERQRQLDPAGFAQRDLRQVMSRLSDSDYKRFIEQQAEIQSSGSVKLDAALTDVDPLLRAAGIDKPTSATKDANDRRYVAFTNAFESRLNQLAAQQGRYPDQKQQREIAASLLRQVTTNTWLPFDERSERVFEAQRERIDSPNLVVPEEEEAKIVEAYRSEGLPPPDEAEIREVYRDMLRTGIE